MRQDVRSIDATASAKRGVEAAARTSEVLSARARLADLGARASAIGHELRQPLFTISMANENLRLMLEAPALSKGQMQQAIERIAEQVQRAQTIITQMLDQASGTRAATAKTEPIQAMDNAIRFLEGLFDTAGVQIERRRLGARAPVPLDGIQMEQIFVNVLRNAVDSIRLRQRGGWSGEGQILIGFQTAEGFLRCIVSDNGAGLEEGVSRSVFRPFVTTKSNEGTGLGLYVCQQILAAVGGTIQLRPGRSEGAEIEIRLPIAVDLQESELAT